jgi:hypothetical protein
VDGSLIGTRGLSAVVALLRATASEGDGDLQLRVELGAGPSGRYAHYRYEAEVYAFLLDQLNAGRAAVSG